MAKIVIVFFFLLLSHPLCADKAPIQVGMSAAFEGSARALGLELYRGATAYFNEVNQQGGIHGRPIIIRGINDTYTPSLTIKNTVQFIKDPSIFLLFGYVGTPTVTRILPLLKHYQDTHTYLFFPFTGAEPQRQDPYKPFVFNLRASYKDETRGLVTHFLDCNRTRIAIFYQADAYGRSGWAGVKDALSDHGLEIVGEATYRRLSRFSDSYQDHVAILSASKPDAIISIGTYAACAGFIRDARDNGLQVPIANVSFVGSESLLNTLQPLEPLTGIDYTQNLINSQVVPSYEDISLPAVRQYRQLMKRQTPSLAHLTKTDTYTPPRFSFVSFEGFLNARLLVQLLNALPTPLKKSDLRATAEGLNTIDLGIGAPLSLRSHQALKRIYYTTVQDGKFVPLKDWSQWKK